MIHNLKSKILGSQPKVLALIAFGILVYMTLAVGRTIYNNVALNKKISQIQSEIAKIEQENNKLQALVLYYKTDAFKEREARLKFNLVKPGESVVNVPKTTQVEEKAQELPTPKIPNPKKWWNEFFGN
jgi:cell division protein FtsB